jgi:hypothetical protein
MKKLLSLTLIGIVGSGMLYAGEFEKKFEMMNSRIHFKIKRYKNNVAAQDFLTKKLACIKNAKSIDDLKACKKQFHPKTLKKLLQE